MRLSPECVPCILKTVNLAVRLAGKDEEVQKEILSKAFPIIISNWDKTPVEVSLEIHRVIRRVTGVNDPFREIKKMSNSLASDLYPMLKKLVEVSIDKLESAIKLAIAGNAIDIVTVEASNFERTLMDTFSRKLMINDYLKFRDKVFSSHNLLYFLDNAGEVYTDKLLLDTIHDIRGKDFDSITIVVRGGPIVNDATMDDLKDAGLDKLPNVSIVYSSNGEEDTGIKPNSIELDNLIKQYDFIISKGMGNYEVLEDGTNIFFLMIAKCLPIAEKLNVKLNDPVLKYSTRD